MQDRLQRQLDEIRHNLDQLEMTIGKTSVRGHGSALSSLASLFDLPAAITPTEVVQLTVTAAARSMPNSAGALCLLTETQELTLNGIWESGRIWLAHHPSSAADLPDRIAARPMRDALRLPLQMHGVQTGELRIWNDFEQLADSAHLLASSASMALGGLVLKQRIDKRETQDPLTGLASECYLFDTLQREIHRAKRNNSSISLALIDLDDFTAYNHRFGNEQGNRMLRAVAGALQASFRGSDVCSRVHGQRFGILLPDAALQDAWRRTSELLNVLASLQASGNKDAPAKLSACAGLAAFPTHAKTATTLFDGAEAALHLAKQQGPGSVCVAQREGIT